MRFSEQYGGWAVIAGASEGTGSAFARRIAAQGVNCLLIARREGQLVALAEMIRAESGVECVTACVDLALPDAGERLAAAAGDREVGLFISNAGSDENNAAFLDGSLDEWKALVARNVSTMMDSCHRFATGMRTRGRGGIVIVGSGACYGGLSGIAVYTATKAFGLCFAEGLWAELRPHGIHVLNLVLGRTDTPAHRRNLAARGQAVPSGLACADDVARIGLTRLPHGPVHNWGLADNDAGYAGSSAAQRRERILMIEAKHRG